MNGKRWSCEGIFPGEIDRNSEGKDKGYEQFTSVVYRRDSRMRQWRACDTCNKLRYLSVMAFVPSSGTPRHPPHEQVFGLSSCKYFVKRLDFEHEKKKGTSRFSFGCRRKGGAGGKVRFNKLMLLKNERKGYLTAKNRIQVEVTDKRKVC